MSLDQLTPPRPDLSSSLESANRKVTLLRWPAQEDLRERLELDGQPRLLLIAAETMAPVCRDELEDWVREPIDADELDARTTTLQQRARVRQLRPRIDSSGLVWVGSRWIDLPPSQLPIARLLIAGLGRVVAAEEIQAVYRATGGSMHPKAIKAMIGRLKGRLAELDLVLTNVRDRGYLLDAPTSLRPDPALQPSRQQ